MKYIISYDITNDRKRTRVSKKLESYGVRMQYSLFECELNQQQFMKLRNDISKTINPKVDSVMYFPMCERCNSNRKSDGIEKVIFTTSTIVT